MCVLCFSHHLPRWTSFTRWLAGAEGCVAPASRERESEKDASDRYWIGIWWERIKILVLTFAKAECKKEERERGVLSNSAASGATRTSRSKRRSSHASQPRHPLIASCWLDKECVCVCYGCSKSESTALMRGSYFNEYGDSFSTPEINIRGEMVLIAHKKRHIHPMIQPTSSLYSRTESCPAKRMNSRTFSSTIAISLLWIYQVSGVSISWFLLSEVRSIPHLSIPFYLII